MKQAIAILLLTISITASAQTTKYKFKVKGHIIPASCVFLAGAADGFNQALSFHYGFVDLKLHLNDKFWMPTVSCWNKYKNGDPAQGAKFPGSTTALVFATDGYHLTRFVDHLFMSGAVAFKIVTYQKKKWYVYIIEAAGYWAMNRAGFALVYNQFKPR